MRRFPRELTNHGGRVPAVAGNGGKPATRDDYQRWRGSDTQVPLRPPKSIRGSVAQVPIPKRSKYRRCSSEEFDEVMKRRSPTNPKRSTMRKDQGKIAPNTPDTSRTRSNEAPRTRQQTSQNTRKKPQKKNGSRDADLRTRDPDLLLAPRGPSRAWSAAEERSPARRTSTRPAVAGKGHRS